MTSAFEVFHVGPTGRSFAAPIDEPATGTTQVSVPAPLAAVRLARLVMCSGDRALLGRAAVATGWGSPTLTTSY